MKYLIVNADDCGYSTGVNKAIEECYRAGRITGVSIMPSGEMFEEAVSMLKSLEKLDVGVHLALTGKLKPVSTEKDRVAGLTGDDGRFVPGYKELAVKYLSGNLKLKHAYPEFRAQIKKTIASGLSVTHLDSHEHIHMFPGILKILVRLAREFGIPYIRVPIEPPVVMVKSFTPRALVRYTLLRTAAGIFKEHMRGSGIRRNDIFYGHFHSGRITDDVFRFMLRTMPRGIAEVAVHPDRGVSGKDSEFNMLMNGAWKAQAGALGIELATHREVIMP